MFQFIGYHALGGPGCLNSAPSQVDGITQTKIQGAIFDHMNMTHNTNTEYGTTIPTQWDYDTIFDADFEGNLSAGNIDILIEQISAVKIKRRVSGTFDWLTLETVPVNGPEDLTFLFIDTLNRYGTSYDYALVPIVEGIEGQYIINTVFSEFNGVFIGDAESTFRFLYDVEYTTGARNQQTGTFAPLGRKFPVVIANGLSSYDSGTVSGTILNDDFDTTGVIDGVKANERKDRIKEFLTNKKPKILKDWSSNIWLCFIVDSPQITYRSGSGLRAPSIQFNWVQIGDAESQEDLYNTGLLDEVN